MIKIKKGLNIDKKVPFSKFCITVMESRRRSNGPVKVVFLRENKENIEYVYCNWWKWNEDRILASGSQQNY